MILTDTLFKPRQLPAWWLRFTESNPIVPSAIALTGLVLICYPLAVIVSASEIHGHGQVIETFRVVSNSKPLVDKAIDLRSAYHQVFSPEVRALFHNLYGNIALYLVVPFLLLLELLFPVNPAQPLIGKGFLQDSIWYVVATPLTILILFPLVGFLSGLFGQYLGFLVITNAKNWPSYIQVTAALLLIEFLVWFTHFARHKIRTLWYFHAVHHSQKELNIFTEDRGHIVDVLAGTLFTFVPFFVFQVSDPYTVAIIGIFKPIHNRFIHANLKINLGWLGWLFSSPQFHRVHHSSDPAHRDKNFGVHFSIYDHIFGTALNNRHVYPETGIEDSRLPTEEKVRLSQLPRNWLVQMAYPFIQVFEQFLAWYRLNFSRMRFRLRRDSNGSVPASITRKEEPQRL